MATALRALAAIPRVAVTVLMAVAIIDMLAGVVLRYAVTRLTAALGLPSVSFFWVEEIGEWALAWITFIGAAIGIRHGTHFAVHMVTDRFPPRWRLAVLVAQHLLIASFGALVAVFGWQVAELNSLSFSPALDLNLRWLYLSSVVGGALIVVYSLAALVDLARGGSAGPDAGGRR
jgi:TRAP-type C4-dicarboxylate transport system permease small subunit